MRRAGAGNFSVMGEARMIAASLSLSRVAPSRHPPTACFRLLRERLLLRVGRLLAAEFLAAPLLERSADRQQEADQHHRHDHGPPGPDAA